MVNLINVIIILHSWRTQQIMVKNYLTLILFMQFFSLLIFSALDLLLFYISFEATLIPMYFLIGFYGSRNRKMDAK